MADDSNVNVTPLLNDLNDTPRHYDTHQWADYIELLALTSEDQFFSSGLFEDVENEAEDFSLDRQEVELDLVEVRHDQNPDPQDELSLLEELESAEIRNQEKINRRWTDIRACLQSRSIRFNNAWPFQLEGDILRVNVDSTNTLHRLYVSLLIASALKWIPHVRRPSVTASLEEIGYHLFTKLLPPHWSIAPFGAHQTIRSVFTGTLFNKFSQLALELNANLIVKENQLDPRDTGDGGIDLVAWHRFNDNLGNLPVAFAQCGCSLSDMAHKLYQASPVNLNSKVQPQHPGANYYFAPHDIRKNDGDWDTVLGEVIMIDRSRIIFLAATYGIQADQVSWSHVDEVLAIRRPMLS